MAISPRFATRTRLKFLIRTSLISKLLLCFSFLIESDSISFTLWQRLIPRVTMQEQMCFYSRLIIHEKKKPCKYPVIEGKRGEGVKARLQWVSCLPAKWERRVFPSISHKFCGDTRMAFPPIFTRNDTTPKLQNVEEKRATNIPKKPTEKSDRLTKQIFSPAAFTGRGAPDIIALNL